ncbi:arrestin domain-containing protein 3-like [Cololabis saira]|uniref:arrestin domain-containing protein 3-like n=1 Tax=Cololabis saira TaxID=129043 RepID=UPI002AD56E5E|nr:arrestin domain-containing protein 3-like [Cololabis saira]
MSSTVKKLEITYNPVNPSNVFACGDTVAGQVSLEVAKDCQINSLLVKFKGKAEVMWTERHGKTTVVYSSKDKYFSYKQYIIIDKHAHDREDLLVTQTAETYPNVVAPGIHVYPFSFQIPVQDLPSSFEGGTGKIRYLLEARLSRSMRIDKTDSTTLNFMSKTDPNMISTFMVPQHESKDKKMHVFNSGTVAMDVNLEKSAFSQGERIKVLASITNNSSRAIKPKFLIYAKHSFFARGKRRLHSQELIKEVGAPIPPSSSEKVTQVITIPHDAVPSILNCSILKKEHRLKVYLDIKYSSDPEVKFDIVILPAGQVPGVAPPPAAAGFGFEPFGTQNPPAWGLGPPQPSAEAFGNQNPPAWGFGPPQPWEEAFGNQNPPARGIGPPQPSSEPQPSDPPPSYGAHAMYPPLKDFGNKYQ